MLMSVEGRAREWPRASVLPSYLSARRRSEGGGFVGWRGATAGRGKSGRGKEGGGGGERVGRETIRGKGRGEERRRGRKKREEAAAPCVEAGMRGGGPAFACCQTMEKGGGGACQRGSALEGGEVGGEMVPVCNEKGRRQQRFLQGGAARRHETPTKGWVRCGTRGGGGRYSGGVAQKRHNEHAFGKAEEERRSKFVVEIPSERGKDWVWAGGEG